jgi:hypothetical protein
MKTVLQVVVLMLDIHLPVDAHGLEPCTVPVSSLRIEEGRGQLGVEGSCYY